MFHFPSIFPKPEPRTVTRYVAATRKEDAAMRTRRTEIHLRMAVENAVSPRSRLLTPSERSYPGQGR